MEKKGFTLIELLAVIIILAVIALIATPIVLNVVENARKSAFQRSANGYYDAARYLYDELYLKNDRQDILFTFEDKVQTSSNENYKLQVKGEAPKGGIVYLSEDGQIMVSIHNGKYCATTDGTGKVNLSEDIENCVQSVSQIPERCFTISNEPIANGYGELDGSEDWMNENYNMLYYNEGEGCPANVDLLVIPSEINGEKVEGIGGWSLGGYANNVIIPTGVRVIDEEAFAYGDTLTNVILPDSLIYIGVNAFYDNRIKNITIPNSILATGSSAFEANQLTSVTILNPATKIGSSAFALNQLTSIVIPEGTTTIWPAFMNNQLTSVTIPNSVTIIESGAFVNNQLTSITIPDSVTTIGNSAFSNNQLANVIIPNSVTEIEGNAFSHNQLTNVTIPNSVTSIGDSAFLSNKLTHVVIPDSVTAIGNQAFRNNQLTSVTIPYSVTTIEHSAFLDNQFSNAQSITIEGDAARFDSQWTLIGFPAK